MYLSPLGMMRSCESDLLRSNGRSEGPVFECSKERLLKLKTPALEPSKNASAKSYTRGAHHRRCAREGLTVRNYAPLKGIWQVARQRQRAETGEAALFS